MAAITNVKVPAAVIPYTKGYLPGPANEQDVPLDKPKPAKKKPETQSRVPWFTTSLFKLPTEAPTGFNGEVEFPTGRGYEGPFVEESAKGQGQYGPEKQLFSIPDNRYLNIKPAEDTWLSEAIGPSKDELDAENNGLRWWWALEHRFMPPGSKWNETVWNGVDRENKWLMNLLKQQAAEKNGLDGSVMSPIAKVRLRGQWLSERNKAIQDYINGNWDDPERAYKDFQDAIHKIDTKLIELGEDPALLRPVPPVAGKRDKFTTTAGPSKLRKQWNYANTVNNKLGEWIASGKINDPTFMSSREAATYLDSTYETLVKYIKESSNSMADAEKKRMQILTLTDEGYDAVVKVIKEYQKALAGVMSSASAKEWSQNNKGKINAVIKAFGFDPDRMDKESLGNQIAALGGIIVSSLARNDELPHDVAVDLKAIEDQYETYMENMMLAANVAPNVVAALASTLGEIAGDQYNDQAFVSGRALSDNLGTIEDLSTKIPRNAVPLSPLLKDGVKFTWPSLAKDPKGLKASTNPESEGENNPSQAYENVPGVELRF